MNEFYNETTDYQNPRSDVECAMELLLQATIINNKPSFKYFVSQLNRANEMEQLCIPTEQGRCQEATLNYQEAMKPPKTIYDMIAQWHTTAYLNNNLVETIMKYGMGYTKQY